jgi:hypothetical protein
MNIEGLFLFLILLFGLLLCSFLGNEGFTGNFSGTFSTNGFNNDTNNINNSVTNSNYDNYNHYNGSSSQLQSGTIFTGSNGGNVVIKTNSDGTHSLEVTFAEGQKPIIFNSSIWLN